MIAAYLCVAIAAALIGLNGGEGNLPAVAICGLGLWFAFGGGERWLERRHIRRALGRESGG